MIIFQLGHWIVCISLSEVQTSESRSARTKEVGIGKAKPFGVGYMPVGDAAFLDQNINIADIDVFALKFWLFGEA
jgi:hypothetical protein